MQILRYWLLVILSMIVIASCNGAQNAVERSFYLGRAHDLKGEYELAIIEYSKAIDADGSLYKAYINRGNAHQMLDHIEQAMADYNKGLEINPHDGIGHLNRGFLHHQLGSFEMALVDYSNVAGAVNDIEEHYLLLRLNASRKVWESTARENLELLNGYVSSNKAPRWPRTISLYYLGREGVTEETVLAEANQADEQARSERICEAYYYLAEERLWRGKKVAAEQYFSKAVETNVRTAVEWGIASGMLGLIQEGKLINRGINGRASARP